MKNLTIVLLVAVIGYLLYNNFDIVPRHRATDGSSPAKRETSTLDEEIPSEVDTLDHPVIA